MLDGPGALSAGGVTFLAELLKNVIQIHQISLLADRIIVNS